MSNPPPPRPPISPSSKPNPNPTPCNRCPNCGFSPVAFLPGDDDPTQKSTSSSQSAYKSPKFVQVYEDKLGRVTPPVARVPGDSPLFRCSGYQLREDSPCDGGWVPDTEEPFDMGLEISPATTLRRRPPPVTAGGSEGFGAKSTGDDDEGSQQFANVPDSEDEADDESKPSKSRSHRRLFSLPSWGSW